MLIKSGWPCRARISNAKHAQLWLMAYRPGPRTGLWPISVKTFSWSPTVINK